MNNKKKIYLLTPLFLVFILFASNLLSAKIFINSNNIFTVWFVFLLIAFSSGLLMGNTIGWKIGNKIVFSVIVVTVFFSNILIVIFESHFSIYESLVENSLLYSLRIVSIGSMAIFGMAISEINILNKNKNKNKNIVSKESEVDNQNNLATNYYLKEAKLDAKKIVFEAKKEAQIIFDRKNQVELQLQELIRIEKEIIEKYETAIIEEKQDSNS